MMKDTSQNPPFGSSVSFLTGSLAGKSFLLRKTTITIGRDVSNDIIIEDDLSVADYHARLLWEQNAWSIEKHPHAGSVTVNQQQIQRSPLQSEAVIGLGKESSFLFTSGPSPDQTLIKKDVLERGESSSASSPLSAQTQEPGIQPTIHFDGLAQSPDTTQIAPLSTIGIPSFEVSSSNSSYKK